MQHGIAPWRPPTLVCALLRTCGAPLRVRGSWPARWSFRSSKRLAHITVLGRIGQVQLRLACLRIESTEMVWHILAHGGYWSSG